MSILDIISVIILLLVIALGMLYWQTKRSKKLWLIDRVMRTMYIGNANTLFFLAFILVILNATLKPLMKLVFLPLTFFSFGFFSLIINAAVLSIAFSFAHGSYMMGFHTAIIASILLSIVNAAINSYIE